MTELTAERTLALRDKLANTPAVAFQAVLHKFCLDVFSRYFSYGTAMEVSVRSVSFPVQAQGLKDTPAAKAIDARHKAWEERMPKDKADLWDWLTTLTGDEQAALFAHCASFGVNALYEKGDRYGAGASSHTVEQRIAEADRLAQAVDLDMVQAGWRPTVENYLGRVPKRRILEAVQEGAGERAAQLIDHLKKGDMAKEAERLLADTGWLPEPLRIDAADDAPVETAEAETDGEALPEFLAGDDEEDGGRSAADDRGGVAPRGAASAVPRPSHSIHPEPGPRAGLSAFQEGRMPTFTIETTYRLPVYRQRSYEAETLAAACALAIADEGWDDEKSDVETSGDTYVTGAWDGRDAAYSGMALGIPSQFGEQVQRKADHFEVLLGLLKVFAHAPDAGPHDDLFCASASKGRSPRPKPSSRARPIPRQWETCHDRRRKGRTAPRRLPVPRPCACRGRGWPGLLRHRDR